MIQTVSTPYRVLPEEGERIDSMSPLFAFFLHFSRVTSPSVQKTLFPWSDKTFFLVILVKTNGPVVFENSK